jgi:NAD kinase
MGKLPRVVTVTRESDYQLLLARHATHGQAEFFLKTRGQSIDELQERHERFMTCLQQVVTAIPVAWRRSNVLRHDLSRFLFEPDDTVIVVGQDGLVANVAKYLDGQPVIGVNPDAAIFAGVLVPHPPEAVSDLLGPASEHTADCESRTMAVVELGDGRRLLALNEIFVGCCTHQSARYRIAISDRQERQSSSGIIVTTGTGATGWARSIHRERHTEVVLPTPEEARLSFFVREAWPSISTGAEVTDGDLTPGNDLSVVSEMNQGGVIFGDGIESDRLEFDWGVTASIRLAARRLELVRG